MNEIIPVEPLWFPPANIIYHGTKKLETETNPDKRKLIQESIAGAIMLVGIIKLAKEPFWLQPTDQKEQTPDIRTMRMVRRPGKPNHMEVQEVEVTTLGEDNEVPSEEIDDFIKRTKLENPKKAYPKTTIILLYINKNMKKTKSWRMIHQSLQGISMPNDVFILARTDSVQQRYQLVKVHPNLDIVEFDVVHELQSNPIQKVFKPKRGLKDVTEVLAETHIPFE